MLPQDRNSDLALVDACVRGSRSAWESLVTRHSTAVRFAVIDALRRCGRSAPDHLIEDLEACVFLRLVVDDFRRLRQFRGQARLKTWLRVMAIHQTLDYLRHERPTVGIDPVTPDEEGLCLADPAEPIDERLEREELLASLRSLWEQLPPDDRQFVQLYYVEELSFEEIAERMQTTLNALYTRKTRIRQRMTDFAARAGWFGGPRRRRRAA